MARQIVVEVDNPEQGQWAFGIVSLPDGDDRAVYFAFYRWAFVVKFVRVAE
jgi:hypothetical protein